MEWNQSVFIQLGLRIISMSTPIANTWKAKDQVVGNGHLLISKEEVLD